VGKREPGQNIFTSVAGYASGSPFVPVGPGSGADASHPASYNTVNSDPIGLDSYEGHISDMTVGFSALGEAGAGASHMVPKPGRRPIREALGSSLGTPPAPT
jgi:hypothetical protein